MEADAEGWPYFHIDGVRCKAEGGSKVRIGLQLKSSQRQVVTMRNGEDQEAAVRRWSQEKSTAWQTIRARVIEAAAGARPRSRLIQPCQWLSLALRLCQVHRQVPVMHDRVTTPSQMLLQPRCSVA